MKLQIPHGHSTLVLFHFTNITAISKAHNHTNLKCMLTITQVVNYTASNIGSESQESDCQKYHETRYEIHQMIMPNSKTKSTSNKWSSLEKQSFEIPHAHGLNLEKCICADTQKDLTQLRLQTSKFLNANGLGEKKRPSTLDPLITLILPSL